MQQCFSDEMEPLFSAESFKVACSSVLKEMAVICDLTDLEKVFPCKCISLVSQKFCLAHNHEWDNKMFGPRPNRLF